jgi:hypothetical protein
MGVHMCAHTYLDFVLNKLWKNKLVKWGHYCLYTEIETQQTGLHGKGIFFLMYILSYVF